MKNKFKNLFYWFSRPVKFKYHEFQLYFYLYLVPTIELEITGYDPEKQYFYIVANLFNLIKVKTDWNLKTDHSGFHFELSLLGLTLEYSYLDCRHWDYNNDKWEE